MIGYTRVSTNEQARTGHGFRAQRAKIRDEAERRGWSVKWVTDDGYSAKDLKRPGITEALHLLRDGEADAIVAAKLDRLSRSMLDLAGLLQRSQDQGWAVVLLDVGVDTTTPQGKLLTGILASVAEWEREVIRERTAQALAEAKARGVRLGRPPAVPDDVVRRIRRERNRGATLTGIAAGLNDDGVPTAHGGAQWHHSTVRACWRELDRLAR